MATDAGRQLTLSKLCVSRETVERLDAYVAMIVAWQRVQNLIAPSTIATIWERHILDSAQLMVLIGGAARVVDLGSGAGLPGMVLAILAKERGGMWFDLVESNLRKAAFLTEAIRATGASATVHAMRVDEFTAGQSHQKTDVVTARALAPLDMLLSLSEPLLTTGARAVFPKGQDVERELTQAAKSWRIVADLIPSLTDGRARIVHVREAERLRGGRQQV